MTNRRNSGTKLLQWHGALGRVYDVLWSPDLGPFQTLHAGIPGADAQLLRIDDFHGYEPRGFYRLRTHFPTAGREQCRGRIWWYQVTSKKR